METSSRANLREAAVELTTPSTFNLGPLLDISSKFLFVYVFTFPVVGALTAFVFAFVGNYQVIPRTGANETYNPYCESFEIPFNILPSICSAIELSVVANVVWRFGLTLTAMPRICISLCYKNYFLHKAGSQELASKLWYRACCATLPLVHSFEMVSLSVMAIVTVNEDYRTHVVSFVIFGVSSCVYVVVMILLFQVSGLRHTQDTGQRSFWVKVVSGTLYIAAFILFSYGHKQFWESERCHHYILFYYAIAEYVAVLFNIIFHTSSYWDIIARTDVVVEPNENAQNRLMRPVSTKHDSPDGEDNHTFDSQSQL